MPFTPSQAAQQVGKTKQGIIKAIKEGRLSADRTPKGGYLIDAAELFRVYRPVPPKVASVVDPNPASVPSGLLVEVATLREQVKHLAAMREIEQRLLAEQIADLRAALDSERQTIKRLTHEHVVPAPQKPRGAFWRFPPRNSTGHS